ncbi:MAG TPA: hypothetical protein VK808_03485, partial [Bacteroidia bacterium]|nr:hypothetical protein [Bacteroidia bacterium]
MSRKVPPTLLFVIFLSFFSGVVKAQNCPTCHDGHNFPGDTLNNARRARNLPHNITPNGNNTLGTVPSYLDQNVCGLNYITESVVTQTRETLQPGTGFPTSMTLPNCLGAPIKAYLYWGCSYYS